MSLKLRIAVALAAVPLLAGCGPLPADSIPGSVATSAPPTVTTTWPTSPPVTATPEALPTSPTVVPTPAQTEATKAAGTNNGGGNTGACAANEYRNVDGVCVHRPVQANQPPPGATAQCNDGTYSFSKHRSGTCSGHKGVKRWL